MAKAQAVGLTHLYVRTGSSVDGFYAAPFLDALLPVAHAGGIKIIGWDFPYLQRHRRRHLAGRRGDHVHDADRRPLGRLQRRHRDPLRRRLADPRQRARGTAPVCAARSDRATRSSPRSLDRVRRDQADYPYACVTAAFDAIAPMVYWIDTPPDEDAAQAVDFLSRLRQARTADRPGLRRQPRRWPARNADGRRDRRVHEHRGRARREGRSRSGRGSTPATRCGARSKPAPRSARASEKSSTMRAT